MPLMICLQRDGTKAMGILHQTCNSDTSLSHQKFPACFLPTSKTLAPKPSFFLLGSAQLNPATNFQGPNQAYGVLHLEPPKPPAPHSKARSKAEASRSLCSKKAQKVVKVIPSTCERKQPNSKKIRGGFPDSGQRCFSFNGKNFVNLWFWKNEQKT